MAKSLSSFNMHSILVVGCGDLGGKVASELVSQGYKVTGVRRRAYQIAGVNIIQADVTDVETLSTLANIQPQIIIYCVAANGQTDENYKAHYVDGLRNVLATQQKNTQLQHVFFVSSTRVYGQKTDALLDEATQAIPADFGGERLLEAEALLSTIACKGTSLRLSGIYGEGRLRMINLAKSPENWPTQNSWTNRIHRDDAAAFIVFLINNLTNKKEISPCYIVSDSAPSSQYEVLTWITEQLKVTPPQHAQAIEGGKRLSNALLLSTGFKLQYPTFKQGYAALLLNS